MGYVVAYLIVSVLGGLFIGRFIYVGHAEDKNSVHGDLKRDEKERPEVSSEESHEEVSRDLVLR
jgi:hypothetical protein